MNALFCYGIYCIAAYGVYRLWLGCVYSKNSFVYLTTICLFFICSHLEKKRLQIIQPKRRMQLFGYVFSVLFQFTSLFFSKKKRYLCSSHQIELIRVQMHKISYKFILKYSRISSLTQICENIHKLKLNSIEEKMLKI